MPDKGNILRDAHQSRWQVWYPPLVNPSSGKVWSKSKSWGCTGSEQEAFVHSLQEARRVHQAIAGTPCHVEGLLEATFAKTIGVAMDTPGSSIDP